MIPTKPQTAGPRIEGPSKFEVILANTLFYGTMLASFVLIILGFMAIVD